MKLFRRNNKAEEQKKAQSRKFSRLQKFLEKAATEGMESISEDMKKIRAEYGSLVEETREILDEYDKAIQEAQAAGEDVFEMVKNKEEIAEAIQGMEKALQDIPCPRIV